MIYELDASGSVVYDAPTAVTRLIVGENIGVLQLERFQHAVPAVMGPTFDEEGNVIGEEEVEPAIAEGWVNVPLFDNTQFVNPRLTIGLPGDYVVGQQDITQYRITASPVPGYTLTVEIR